MPEIKASNKDLFSKYTFEEKQRLYEAAAELYSDNKRQLFDRLVKNRTRKRHQENLKIPKNRTITGKQ